MVSPAESQVPLPSGLPPTQRLDSPERVRLELELAGPMSRAFASSIDYCVILVLMLGLLLLLVSGLQQVLEWASEWSPLRALIDSLTEFAESDETEPGPEVLRGLALVVGIYLILELVLTSAYFIFFETLLAGRTLGKRLTGLRVVSDTGGLIGWRASLIRNLLRAVDSLPSGYFVGLVALMLSPRSQRLGDLAAGTLVIRERRLEDNEVFEHRAVDREVEAGFRFTREELARVGESERHLIRRTLRRAETLSPAEAELIVGRATDAICRKIGRQPTLAPATHADFLVALLQASERLL